MLLGYNTDGFAHLRLDDAVAILTETITSHRGSFIVASATRPGLS